MPIDLMYGSPTMSMDISSNQFAGDLRIRLEEAYQRVRKQMGQGSPKKPTMTKEHMESHTKDTWCGFTLQ